jgi:hypothetical protein
MDKQHPNPEDITKNPIQQEVVELLLDDFEARHDDIYDIANFIASLRKVEIAIRERYPLDKLPKAIELAMQDWPLETVYDQWNNGKLTNLGGFHTKLFIAYREAGHGNKAALRNAFPHWFTEKNITHLDNEAPQEPEVQQYNLVDSNDEGERYFWGTKEEVKEYLWSRYFCNRTGEFRIHSKLS